MLSAIRVLLAASAGADLTDVAAADLVFDATDSGAIFVTDLVFLRTAEPTG